MILEHTRAGKANNVRLNESEREKEEVQLKLS